MHYHSNFGTCASLARIRQPTALMGFAGKCPTGEVRFGLRRVQQVDEAGRTLEVDALIVVEGALVRRAYRPELGVAQGAGIQFTGDL